MAISNLKLKTALSLLCILCIFVPFVLLIFGALVKPADRDSSSGNETATPFPIEGFNGSSSNVTKNKNTCFREDKKCKKGLIIPTWKPEDIQGDVGQMVLRAVVYFLVMFFFFLGISVIADKFMASIETITSQERKVKFKLKNGEVKVTKVRVWNETVSNLTLMALGSSAPEIMLAIIEIFGNDFNAGQLGPGTIVGSAAFNLFVIIGICVYVIPEDQVRRQKHLSVFFCTSSWSIFAYIWLYVIIAAITPGRIAIWESLLTFAYFPMLVFNAYLLDTQIIFKKFLAHRYRTDHTYGNAVTIVSANDGHDIPLRNLRQTSAASERHSLAPPPLPFSAPDSSAFENSCYAPTAPASPQDVESGAATLAATPTTLTDRRPPSCPTNRHLRPGSASSSSTIVAATPSSNCSSSQPFTVAVVSPNEISSASLRRRVEDAAANATTPREFLGESPDDAVIPWSGADPDAQNLFHFKSSEIKVVESAGEVEIKVIRRSSIPLPYNVHVVLPYHSMEGSAKYDQHFEKAAGSLIFQRDESEKIIRIGVIDEGCYEKDLEFFVELEDPTLVSATQNNGHHHNNHTLYPPNSLSGPVSVYNVGNSSVDHVNHNQNHNHDNHSRYHNLRGDDDDDDEEGKSIDWVRLAPTLGDRRRVAVRIRESKEYKSTVDKLLKRTNNMISTGSHAWRQQFVEAFKVIDDEEEEDAEPREPSCVEYLVHFLSLFWKVLFATVPPTEMLNGWFCFVVSICWIGVLTTVVGDVASHVGCTIGMKDTVTAISFVALGTSVPDTFASKIAAIQDEHADNSIGNVTGSNAVNVFLGVGIAWSVAAIYHAVNDSVFEVEVGSLGFALTVYCLFAVVAVAVLVARRSPRIAGGELGGPYRAKLATTALFISLWFAYIVLNGLESYCYIPGFG